MSCFSRIDKKQLFNLLTGMLGIYVLYFMAGILHESIIKQQFHNIFTGEKEICPYPFGITFIPMIVAWIMGLIYVKCIISDPVVIPHKNAALTGLAATSAAFFSILAVKQTSYPVVLMMESSSILPVIFVAVFCTRVTDQRLKLGPKKIIVAVIIAVGILIFELSDPSNHKRQQKQQLIGLVFVLGFFIADGFLPDLQAEIKVKYKPQPVEMMAQVNKWGTIYMFLGMTVTGNIFGFGKYMIRHPLFSLQLFAMSVISGFGQFFVYRMIKQFKQHFVPFTITSRKILTVAISIVVYKHQTNFFQIFGILLVLLTVTVQFVTEISTPQPSPPAGQEQQNNYELNQQINEDPNPSSGYQRQGIQNIENVKDYPYDQKQSSMIVENASEKMDSQQYNNDIEMQKAKDKDKCQQISIQ